MPGLHFMRLHQRVWGFKRGAFGDRALCLGWVVVLF